MASNFPLTYTFFLRVPSDLYFKTQNCIGKETVWSFPLEFSGANEIATRRILDRNSPFYLLLLMMSKPTSTSTSLLPVHKNVSAGQDLGSN